MSFMTGKDSSRFTTKGEADFIIGCGGVEEPIYYTTTLQFLYPQEKNVFLRFSNEPGKKCITTVSKENFEKKVTTTMVKLDIPNKQATVH